MKMDTYRDVDPSPVKDGKKVPAAKKKADPRKEK